MLAGELAANNLYLNSFFHNNLVGIWWRNRRNFKDVRRETGNPWTRIVNQTQMLHARREHIFLVEIQGCPRYTKTNETWKLAIL